MILQKPTSLSTKTDTAAEVDEGSPVSPVHVATTVPVAGVVQVTLQVAVMVLALKALLPAPHAISVPLAEPILKSTLPPAVHGGSPPATLAM